MKKMLSFYAVSIFCAAIHAQNYNVEHDHQINLSYKKLYVESDKIVLLDNQLYLNQNNQMMGVHSLFSDSHGIYLKAPIVDSWWTCIHK